MAGRGNKVPKEVKIARGTDDKSPQKYFATKEKIKKQKFENTKETRLSSTPPEHLSQDAKKAWRILFDTLVMKEVAIIENDTTSFELLCTMYAEWQMLGVAIDEAKCRGAENKEIMEIMRTRIGHYGKILHYLKEFGLTPKSRELIQNARGKRDNEVDEMSEEDKFLDGLIGE